MKTHIRTLLLILLTLSPGTAAARLVVVATTSDMALLAREIGADRIELTLLAPPDRDAHHLQARPSMIRAMRKADLLIATGAELETGWLPAALQSAGNPRIRPGRPGYFQGADHVPLLNADQPIDRAQGDVHPAGDPHFSLDPVRFATVGQSLAGRFGTLDPDHAARYAERARLFAEEIERRLPDWQRRAAGAPGVVSFHRDIDYLLHRFEIPSLGYLEPVPGIPPTASHLQRLVRDLQGTRGIVLRHPYQPAHPAQQLAERLNWEVKALPLLPPADGDATDYFALIDAYIDAAAQ